MIGMSMIFLDSAYPVLSCVLAYAALAKLGRFGEFEFGHWFRAERANQ
jgi:hypothetical protein